MVIDSYDKLSHMITYSKANLSEIVVSYVKNKIQTGELKSGDRLVETDMSEELQISRAPIREALRELNMRGILTFSPKKGSQILEMGYEDIIEVFSIRIPLEMQTLTIIFEKSLLKEQDLDYLEALNENMIKPERDSDIEDKEKTFVLNTSDMAFHKFFWEKSGSFRRAEILENQYFQLLIAMNQDLSTLGSMKEKFAEHKAIIEACRTGSLEKTLSAFQAHMDSYLKAVTKL